MQTPNILKVRTVMRSVAAAAAVIAMTAAPAFADVRVTHRNGTTGPGSLNRNNFSVDATMRTTVTNSASETNRVDATATTGDNDVSNNTAVSDGLETGEVRGDASFTSDLNSGGGVDLGDADQDVTVDADNDTTGPDSENRNTVNVRNRNTVDVRNDARLTNDVRLRANTGDNSIRNNTTVGGGGLRTGGVDLNVSTDSRLNNGASSVNLGSGNHSVDVSTGNNMTGPDSSNINNVDIDHSNTVNVTNTASVTNNVNLNANTGGNTVRRNTSAGGIQTGGVSLSFDSNTSANSQ